MSDLSGLRPTPNHMVVIKDPETTRDLPAHSDEYLDDQALIARSKKLGKELSVLKIHSLHNQGPKLSVAISIDYFAYKKKHLNRAIFRLERRRIPL